MFTNLDADAIGLNLMAAGALTLIVGAVMLVRLQRAILRNIAASPETTGLAAATVARRAADAPLALAIEDALSGSAESAPDRPILRRMALAHAAAGLAFGTVAALLLLPMSGSELYPLRTAVVIWAFAWPAFLVLNILVGPDRTLQMSIVLGYLGVLAILSAIGLSGTPAMPIGDFTLPGFFVPVLVWAIYALPSVLLLLFLNRTIRTIGPLLLVLVLVLLGSSHILLSVLDLPLIHDNVMAFPIARDLGGEGLYWTVAALGLVAGSWPAWRSVVFLRDRYAAKRSSDLSLTVATIWLFQALTLAFSLTRAQGAIGAAAAVLPLLAWRLALYVGLRPVAKAARTRPPSRLLLLRVFGFGRRSRRLLDLIGARWRLIGSIDLIAAPDLAARTVEPSTFIAFVRGELADLFIRTPEQLQERLATLDHGPDPDGRFRINQLFCADAMWRDAVTRLMAEASLVVMDLRGFGPQRRGCVFELQTLLDTVPLDRLVVLFDKSTDRNALEALLAERWRELDPASPNLASQAPRLRLVDASDSDTHAVHRLMAIAGEQTLAAQ